MNKQLSLQAFTLMEVMMTMALLAILVLLGYKIFGIVEQSLYRYTTRIEQTYDQASLELIIRKDIQQAQEIETMPSGDICMITSYNKPKICLEKTDSLLIRKYVSQRDTFAFQGSWKWDPVKQTLMLEDTLNDLRFLFVHQSHSRAR